MTEATLTLTDFLLARIAEDEAIARRPTPDEMNEPLGRDALGDLGWFDEYEYSQPVLAMPVARVLAECEAKRRIVALHADDQPYCSLNFSNADHAYFEGACDNLRILAAVYADHPDYRQEWTP